MRKKTRFFSAIVMVWEYIINFVLLTTILWVISTVGDNEGKGIFKILELKYWNIKNSEKIMNGTDEMIFLFFGISANRRFCLGFEWLCKRFKSSILDLKLRTLIFYRFRKKKVELF